MSDNTRQLLKGTTTILVLSALRDQSMHGYALVQNMADRSRNMIAFKEGTIYPLLYSLEKQGFINSSWKLGESNRNRKVYAITNAGQKYLDEKVVKWKHLVKAMDLGMKEV